MSSETLLNRIEEVNIERHPAEPVSVARSEGTATRANVSFSGEEVHKKLDLSNCHYKATEIYDSQIGAKLTTQRMGLRDFGVQCEMSNTIALLKSPNSIEMVTRMCQERRHMSPGRLREN